MRLLISLAVLLYGAAALAGPVTPAEWRQLIDTCRSGFEADSMEETLELSDAEFTQMTLLAASCPELAEQFEQHPWRSLLPRPADAVTVLDPSALQRLQDSYLAQHAGGPRNLADLQEILDELPESLEEETSLWTRLLEWLGDKFGSEQNALPGWWQELSVAEDIFDWILYFSIGVVVVLALGIIANEIVQYRKGRRRLPPAEAWDVAAPDTSVGPGLEEVRRAPAWLRAGLLLEMILGRLEAQRKLAPRAGMTHRGVIRAADNLPQRAVITSLATAAERATYGGWRPDAEDVEGLVREGESALETLASGT